MIFEAPIELALGLALVFSCFMTVISILISQKLKVTAAALKTSQSQQTELALRVEQSQQECDSQRDQAYHWQQQYQSLLRSHGQLEAKVTQMNVLQNKLETLQLQVSENQQEAHDANLTVVRLKQEQQAFTDKIQLLEQSEHRLQQQFENLANRIFDEKSQTLRNQNQAGLDALLGPLRQQLDSFRQQVQQSYDSEAKERHALRDQIIQLQQLNVQMSEETINLTKALKGDNKQQGNWGEVVLERILEESGLKEGREYHTQVTGKNQHGQVIKPDVIVQLPKGKSVVIDSKVILTAYERYHSADEELVRQQALTEHARALRTHILGLAKKDYQTLHSIRSLDYVLLFVPIEGAYLAALEAEPALVNLALQHNILLVSPTNLLVALRTIQNLWRVENQQQNAIEIAERAGKLYDKFCLFIDDLQRVGEQLDRAQDSYQGAMNKLSRGRGNLVRQAELLRAMQIPVSKRIDESLQAEGMASHEATIGEPQQLPSHNSFKTNK